MLTCKLFSDRAETPRQVNPFLKSGLYLSYRLENWFDDLKRLCPTK